MDRDNDGRPDGSDDGGPDDGRDDDGDGAAVCGDDGGRHGGRRGGGGDGPRSGVVVIVHLLLDGGILRDNSLLLHLLLGLRGRNGARLPVAGSVSGRVEGVVDLEPDAGVGRLAALAARGVDAKGRGVAVGYAEAGVEALLGAALESFSQLLAARDTERRESSRGDAQRGGGAGGGSEGQEAGGEESRATTRGSHDFSL